MSALGKRSNAALAVYIPVCFITALVIPIIYVLCNMKYIGRRCCKIALWLDNLWPDILKPDTLRSTAPTFVPVQWGILPIAHLMNIS